uniref:DUF1542 domain-containing protein n=1 Tax=Staphylococcus hominis TaxID=1290 RepID=UPI0011A8E09C
TINAIQPQLIKKSQPTQAIHHPPTANKEAIHQTPHPTTQQKQPPKPKLHQPLTQPKGNINQPINNSALHQPKTNRTTTINPIQPQVIKKSQPTQPIDDPTRPNKEPIQQTPHATTQEK